MGTANAPTNHNARACAIARRYFAEVAFSHFEPMELHANSYQVAPSWLRCQDTGSPEVRLNA
jgi:hypothetical protein